MHFNYISLLMIESSIITLFLSIYMGKHRDIDNPAVLSLSWLLVSATIWSFFYGLEVASANLVIMKILNAFGYIGITTIPIFWFIFAAYYCGSKAWLTASNIALLFIIPALTLTMVATNDLHHLYYATVQLKTSGIFSFQKIEPAFFYWIHIIYSFLVFLAGLVLFIRMFFNVPRQNRLSIAIFIAGASFPYGVTFAYVLGLKPFGFLDLTPVAFIFTGIILSIGVYTIDLFDVIPLALDMLFKHIPDAIIVLDMKGNVVNANPVGKEVLKLKTFQETANDKNTYPFFLENSGIFSEQNNQMEFGIGEKTYLSTNKSIKTSLGKRLGTLIMIRDVSQQKYQEKIQNVLYNISKNANINISLTQLYENLHQQLGLLIDTKNFYIALLDEENNKVYFPYNTDEEKCEYQPRPLNYFSLNTLVLKIGKPFFITKKMIDESEKFSQYREWFGSNRKVWLGVPLKVEEKTIGALVVQSYTDPNCYAEKDIQLMEFISSQISIAIRRIQDEESLRKSQQEFSILFQGNPEATVYTDKEGNIINVNARFAELFGYTMEELKGTNLDSGLIQPPDRMREAKEFTSKAINDGHIVFETIRKKKDGTLFPVNISATSVSINGEVQGTIAVYYDITERKNTEEQLKKMARLDPLTQCYNRGYGLELFERQIKLAYRNQSPLLITFLDIDYFKKINDTFGHNEGDKVLTEVAELFRSTLREVDIICRMGGDEFLLLLPDSSLEDSFKVRDRFQEKLAQLNNKSKKDYQIQFSIGFSEYQPNKPESLDMLISVADRRMYEEKREKLKSV